MFLHRNLALVVPHSSVVSRHHAWRHNHGARVASSHPGIVFRDQLPGRPAVTKPPFLHCTEVGSPSSRRDFDVRAREIELHGRTVFVLNGLCSLDDDAIERLLEAAQKDPDAVAFGCMNGKWVAAA